MSFDWEHQFCLGCDKQTDGAIYCSESCRLADYEKTSPSSPSSTASSPSLSNPPLDWNLSRPTKTTDKFYLSPAYNFGLAQTDSNDRAYARSSLAAFSVSCAGSSPADELLRIEQRLVCDADGERVWLCVESLRVLVWARPKL